MSEKEKEGIRQAVADYMRSELPEDVKSRILQDAYDLITQIPVLNQNTGIVGTYQGFIAGATYEWRLGQQDSLKQLNEIHCLKVENHQLEFGLMKIELAQKAELLKSCESALEDRDKEIAELREALKEALHWVEQTSDVHSVVTENRINQLLNSGTESRKG